MSTEGSADAPSLYDDLARDPAFVEALKDDRFADAVAALLQNRTFYKGADPRRWVGSWRDIGRFLGEARGLGEPYARWLEPNFTSCWPEEREAERQRRNFAASSPFTGKTVVEEPERPEDLELADRIAAHLTKLGWRLANADDNAREEREALQRRIAILREIEGLEARAEAPAPAWAQQLALRSERGPIFAEFHRIVRTGDNAFRVAEPEGITQDEREATSGQLYARLCVLALSGRISQEEFDRVSLQISMSPWQGAESS